MNDYADQTGFGVDERFAIGQPVARSEDPVLLRGEGRCSDDVNLPGQAYAVMVRSHYAHGVIRRVDTAAARVMPGVLGRCPVRVRHPPYRHAGHPGARVAGDTRRPSSVMLIGRGRGRIVLHQDRV
jgi:hypothetical protein